MAQRIKWLECLLPKPKLASPVLMDFFTTWRVVDVCGEELEVLVPPPATDMAAVLRQLTSRYPDLVVSSQMLDFLME